MSRPPFLDEKLTINNMEGPPEDSMRSIVIAMEAYLGAGAAIQGTTKWLKVMRSMRIYYIHYSFSMAKQGLPTAPGEQQALVGLIPWKGFNAANFNIHGQASGYPTDDNFIETQNAPTSENLPTDINSLTIAPGNTGRYPSLVEFNVKAFHTTTQIIPVNITGSIDFKPTGRYLERGSFLWYHMDAIDNSTAGGNTDLENWIHIVFAPALDRTRKTVG